MLILHFNAIIMKTASILSFLGFAIVACANPKTPAATTITFIEGEGDSNAKAHHTILVNNPPKGEYSVSFSMIPIDFTMAPESEGRIINVCGPSYRLEPKDTVSRDTLCVRYVMPPLRMHPWAPEGFYLVDAQGNTTKLEVEYRFLPLNDAPGFYADYAARTAGSSSPMNLIPQAKQTELKEGYTYADAKVEYITLEQDAAKVHGWYRLTLDGGVMIESCDADGAYYAMTSFKNLLANAKVCNPQDVKVQNCVITDWPDMQYRGLMIDVSRNFIGMDKMKMFVDQMERYKLNTLQFHLIDDEGWRLEIKGIPELTSIGAFHKIGDESQALLPSYSGLSGEEGSVSDGYYTREEFIDFLKYADAKHIKVITEIESPGHARAAIVSMKAYAERTGDTSMILHDPDDRSVYCSAQEYRDNAMNVVSEGLYKFMAHVIDDVKSMYEEAGLVMDCVHLGGDEVPDGAWTASPQARKFMQEHGYTKTSQLKAYFVRRMVEICNSRNIKIGGWQEIAMNNDELTRKMLADACYGTNSWKGSAKWTQKLCDDGYNVIFCDYTNCYMDMHYVNSKEEFGATWGGAIDCRKAFMLLPYKDLKTGRNADKIIGVQAQLWAETLRSFHHFSYSVFPKALPVFERAWNTKPEFKNGIDAAFEDFYAQICDYEMPQFQAAGLSFRIPPVGMKLEDGRLMYLVAPSVKDYVVRYTTDGSTPCETSPVLENGMPANGPATIKARLFAHGQQSITSTLIIE